MDKYLDSDLYDFLDQLLLDQANQLPQRKILHTRILKLSTWRIGSSTASIGTISSESGQHQKALLQLKKAIIINPNNYYTQISCAKVLFKLEKENEAFSHLKKALCLDPISSYGHQTVIRRFQERGSLEDLESFYQDVANQAANTNFINFPEALYSGCGQALTCLNEYPKALDMFKKAFETGKMDSHSHSNYAVALYRRGLFEEAMVHFEHAREQAPGERYAINNIAYMNYCLGKLQKACEEFEEIIANGWLTPGTYSNFILVLFHMDKGEEMIGRYRDLLQQNIGENVETLQRMYEEALRITQVILERDEIDEETREFNTKKIEGLNLVLSFIN